MKHAWKTTDDLRNQFLIQRDEARKELAEAHARISHLEQLGKQRDEELASDLADMKYERDEARARIAELEAELAKLKEGTPCQRHAQLENEMRQRAELAESKLAAALALTDTGSTTFYRTFGALAPNVSGWRVVEKIRSTLLDGSQTP